VDFEILKEIEGKKKNNQRFKLSSK